MKTYSRKRKSVPSSPDARLASSPRTPLHMSSPNSAPFPMSSPATSPINPPTPTAPRKRKRTVRLASEATAPKLAQLHFVFNKPLNDTCKVCYMTYSSVSPHDLELHRRFHSRALDGRDWPSDYGKRVWSDTQSSDYITRVDASSRLAEKRAAEDVISLVNTELNAPQENQAWRNCAGKGAVFLYIRNKRAVGMVVVERADEARWMVVSSCELIDTGSSAKVMMGISRIYTARNHRQRNVATKLLEVASEKFVYGMKLAKSQIAWSQPSASGGIVAGKWSGVPHGDDKKVLVYIE